MRISVQTTAVLTAQAFLLLGSTVLALDSRVQHKRHVDIAQHRRGQPDPTPGFSGVPPLAQITFGQATATPSSVFTSFAAGATPTLKGAPPVPTVATQLNPADYPPLDKQAWTNGSAIADDMAKMHAAKIPNIPVNIPIPQGSTQDLCSLNPAAKAVAGANGTCWWSCGGCVRADNDVSVCPDKNTWGVSFDDGPSDYTANVLDYLHSKDDSKATFFVVGSRVVERPQLLQTQYLLGHEISVHTWSHKTLTTITNEQIVAELSWTKKVIKDVLGVTPVTFRAPFGDIDDRVRAVAKSIGLTPIQWTGNGDLEFDTNDWTIPGNEATGVQVYQAFGQILDSAAKLDTGFIVLEHDVYQQEVFMSTGYFLPLAASRNFKLEAVGQCRKQSLENSYLETLTTTGPFYSSGDQLSSSSTGSSGNGNSTTPSGSVSKPSGTTPAGQSLQSSRPSNAAVSVKDAFGSAHGAVSTLLGAVLVGILASY